MKKIIISVIFIFSYFNIFAQSGIAINTTNAQADPSAMLDIRTNSSCIR
ncbi:MAG TPA: hypothetical protein P5250_02960 [Bacteroidales bacterium]|nr:hypothetical protein [Bacteroidales bacterium]